MDCDCISSKVAPIAEAFNSLIRCSFKSYRKRIWISIRYIVDLAVSFNGKVDFRYVCFRWRIRRIHNGYVEVIRMSARYHSQLFQNPQLIFDQHQKKTLYGLRMQTSSQGLTRLKMMHAGESLQET